MLFKKIGKHRDFIHRKRKAIGYYDGTRDFSDSKANRRAVRLDAIESKVIDMEIEWMRQSKEASERNAEILKNNTGGNEMEKGNLQKLIGDNFTAGIVAIATKMAVEKNFPQDAILELIETSLKDEPKYDFIDFPISVHDGTGVTRLQELYMHLENGWKIERVQDNSEIDNHFYFTLVREAEEETKHMIDPADLNEIMEVLEHGSLSKAPYIVNDVLSNGEQVPEEVTREFYLDLHVDIALNRIYDLLGNYDGAEE